MNHISFYVFFRHTRLLSYIYNIYGLGFLSLKHTHTQIHGKNITPPYTYIIILASRNMTTFTNTQLYSYRNMTTVTYTQSYSQINMTTLINTQLYFYMTTFTNTQLHSYRNMTTFTNT